MKRFLTLALCALLLFGPVRAEEAPSAGRLPDEVLMSYFDRSLFVGDSVVVMFRNHVRAKQEKDPAYFAGVKFYCAYNYQLRTAARENTSGSADRVELKYKGRETSFAHILEAEQPDRVFILAGLNERIHLHLDWADDYLTRIRTLRDKYSPKTALYFLSMTPVRDKIGMKRQQGHDAYNDWLSLKCAEIGALYVDIASGLKAENGMMMKGLSSDGEFHLNDAGNAIVAAELLDFAQSQYENGLWTPGATAP